MLSITHHRIIEFTLIFQSLWEKIIQPPAYKYALPWVSEENNQKPQPTHRTRKPHKTKSKPRAFGNCALFRGGRCPCLPLRCFKSISRRWAPACAGPGGEPVRGLGARCPVRHEHSPSYVTEFGLCTVRVADATKVTLARKAAQCKHLLCMCLFCLLKFVPKSLSLKLSVFWNTPLYGVSYLTVSWGRFFGSKSVSQEPFSLTPAEKRRAKPSAYHKAAPPQRKD